MDLVHNSICLRKVVQIKEEEIELDEQYGNASFVESIFPQKALESCSKVNSAL